jgi:hypothetical protein
MSSKKDEDDSVFIVGLFQFNSVSFGGYGVWTQISTAWRHSTAWTASSALYNRVHNGKYPLFNTCETLKIWHIHG